MADEASEAGACGGVLAPLFDAAPPADGGACEDEGSRVVVATVVRPLLPHELAGAHARAVAGTAA